MSHSVNLIPKLDDIVLGYIDPMSIILRMLINNFRGDLSNIMATTKTLVTMVAVRPDGS